MHQTGVGRWRWATVVYAVLAASTGSVVQAHFVRMISGAAGTGMNGITVEVVVIQQSEIFAAGLAWMG